MTLTNILVPIDFSANATLALAEAVGWPPRLGRH